ncbi:MAG: hypothetical protein GX987_04100 [Tissierellia bacterium]|nr:hypothetical protein [Tissierellia bacterium]
METRIEKRKRHKKEKRKNFYKFIVLILTLFIFYYGIKVVNESIVYLDYLKNPNIFKLDIREKKIDLFGRSYLIDLKILKKDE